MDTKIKEELKKEIANLEHLAEIYKTDMMNLDILSYKYDMFLCELNCVKAKIIAIQNRIK